MKRLLIIMLVLVAFTASNAQNSDYKKLPSFGFHFTVIDFKTAADLRAKSIAQVLREKNWYRANRYSPALTLSYMQGLSNSIDFSGRLTASFLAYPLRNSTAIPDVNDRFYAEADANVNIKLLSDEYTVVPYVQLGAGVTRVRESFLAYIPIGAGLQFNLWDDAMLHLNTSYRVPVNNRANYSLAHSLGLSFPLIQRKAPIVTPLPTPLPPPDRDGDGILDASDACPDVPGLTAFNGCPDTDKDGIADKDDKCPSEFGMAKYQGCPIPDTDKDGINDENDKCPDVFGLARYDGCAIPDTDGDGVNDEEDKCKNIAGIAGNAGCPEIKQEVIQKVSYAAKNIFFNTGSSQLLKKSFKPLDEVVTIMNENPTLLLDVEGHTDNTGTPEKNQTLSESRAESVKSYLVSKGIDASRLISAGYGQDRPIADNKTVAGRTQNRRSELKLRSY